jgi:hypothetical protein
MIVPKGGICMRWQAENARKRDEFERELERIGAIAYAVTETRVRVIFPGGELDVDMAFYPEGPFFDLNGYHWTALET